MFRNSVAVFLLVLTVSTAEAQLGTYHGSIKIGGRTFSCGTAQIRVVSGLGDLGRAYPGQGMLLDISLNNYPVGVIGFIFAHECAHVLGIMNEDAADAWAIKIGRNQGWLGLQDLRNICATVYFSTGDWTHLPGPIRCRRMVQHFSTY